MTPLVVVLVGSVALCLPLKLSKVKSVLDNFLAWRSTWDGFYDRGYEDFNVFLTPESQSRGPAVAVFPVDYTLTSDI